MVISCSLKHIEDRGIGSQVTRTVGVKFNKIIYDQYITFKLGHHATQVNGVLEMVNNLGRGTPYYNPFWKRYHNILNAYVDFLCHYKIYKHPFAKPYFFRDRATKTTHILTS